jgi:L-fuconolactonase
MTSAPVVDAHQHLFDISSLDYAWMDAAPVQLRRSFGAAELDGALVGTGVHSTIVVQATSGSAETEWLLGISAQPGPIVGVVGWVDLTSPGIADNIARLRNGDGVLLGVRHQINGEPDAEWVLRPDVIRGLRAVCEAGLPFDLLVRPEQWDSGLELARQMPELQIVLDHAGSPALLGEPSVEWSRWIVRMAEYENVTCKVSGLVGRGDPRASIDRIRRSIDTFSPQRSMVGSDWPVSTLAGSYSEVWWTIGEAIDSLSGAESDDVLGLVATNVYGLTPRGNS